MGKPFYGEKEKTKDHKFKKLKVHLFQIGLMIVNYIINSQHCSLSTYEDSPAITQMKWSKYQDLMLEH